MLYAELNIAGPDGLELVHYWLNYYNSMVDKIVICTSENLSGIVNPSDKVCIHKAFVHDIIGERQHDLGMVQCMHAGMRPEDWRMTPDLDEHFEFPYPPKLLATMADQREVMVIYGRFVDRFAADGTLAEALPWKPDGPTLAEQYPIKTRFTKMVARNDAQKVMMAKGNIRIGSGHHDAFLGVHTFVEQYPIGRPEQFVVNHYKFRDTMKKRFEMILASPQRSEIWTKEAERIQDYLAAHGGKVNFHDPVGLVIPSPTIPLPAQ